MAETDDVYAWLLEAFADASAGPVKALLRGKPVVVLEPGRSTTYIYREGDDPDHAFWEPTRNLRPPLPPKPQSKRQSASTSR